MAKQVRVQQYYYIDETQTQTEPQFSVQLQRTQTELNRFFWQNPKRTEHH